jgi:predicted transcriptional regulator
MKINCIEVTMKTLPSDPLTPAEWVVMKTVWQLGQCTALEVFEHVKKQHDWAVTTVKTMLSKLVQKGVISTEEDGRRFLYSALVSSEELLKEAADSFLAKSTDDIKGQMLCYMVNQVNLSNEDIDELQALLDQHKKKQGNE